MSSSTTCGALVDGSGSLASLRICGVIGSPSSAPAVPMKKSTSGSSSPASLALSRAARATASVAASTPFLPASSRPSASTTSEVLSFKPSGPSLRSTTGGRGQGKLTPSGSEPTAPRAAPFTVLPSASIVTRVCVRGGTAGRRNGRNGHGAAVSCQRMAARRVRCGDAGGAAARERHGRCVPRGAVGRRAARAPPISIAIAIARTGIPSTPKWRERAAPRLSPGGIASQGISPK
mmetsp:Transcript_7736/g.19726  ORF Transcript_7736/g.19726 Transcript_7736/m.19726 type:complete len:234 (+) Transcript_7736:297-998(+)